MDFEETLEATLARWGDDGLVGTLLADRTMGRPLRWATDSLAALGPGFGRWDAMTPAAVREAVRQGALCPRAAKAAEARQARVRAHGEVFTPAHICKRMTDLADTPWLRADPVPTTEDAFAPNLPPTPIAFRPGKRWQDYVRLRRLEITCGEAPFLAARYDAATGAPIPWTARYGLLDRKLRALPRCLNRTLWQRWAERAFAAIYGYEYQGDNLFLARVNLLLAFEEAHRVRWGGAPAPEATETIANILAYNLWQIDGLTGLPPAETPANPQGDLFAPQPHEPPPKPCTLRLPVKQGKTETFQEILLDTLKTVKGDKAMKFDFIIGNPPYQGEAKGDNATYTPPYTHAS